MHKEMRYFWSTVFETGMFDFWEAVDEADVKRKIAKKYCGRAFDFGETTAASYLRFNRKEGKND